MHNTVNFTLEDAKEIIKSKDIDWDTFCGFSFSKQRHILNSH
jgi:hypothetical protein